MTGKIIYQYTDDSWWSSNGCDCCDADYMECYNAVGWEQNGSAHDLHKLYSDVLFDYLCRDEEVDLMEVPLYNPYKYLTLDELVTVLDRLGIVVEEIENE